MKARVRPGLFFLPAAKPSSCSGVDFSGQNAVVFAWRRAILALRFARLSDKPITKVMYLKTSRKSAFTLVEIMIVVAIIGLLAAVAIPNLVKARKSAQRQACINNLKAIDG